MVNEAQFERDFDTGKVICKELCRFVVANSIIRVVLGPEGIVILLPESLRNSPHLLWLNDTEYQFTSIAP